MGDLVNLNRARKAKGRADREREAAANRAAFGRTNAEKLAQRREGERREQLLDGARRATDELS